MDLTNSQVETIEAIQEMAEELSVQTGGGCTLEEIKVRNPDAHTRWLHVLFGGLGELGIGGSDRRRRLTFLELVFGRDLKSSNELNFNEVRALARACHAQSTQVDLQEIVDEL